MRKSMIAKRIEESAKSMHTWQKINRVEDLFKEINRESKAAAQTTIVRLQAIAARQVRGENVG